MKEFFAKHEKILEIYRLTYFRTSTNGKKIIFNIETKDRHNRRWKPADLLEMPAEFYKSIPEDAYANGRIMAEKLYPVYQKLGRGFASATCPSLP